MDNWRTQISVIFCSIILSIGIFLSVQYYSDSNVWEIYGNDSKPPTILFNNKTGMSFHYNNGFYEKILIK